MKEHIDNRAMGELPISFGSAQPIQAIVGMGAVAENIKIDKGTHIWINVATLVRNIYSALDKETQAIVGDAELSNTAFEEMEVIYSAIEQYAPTLVVQFYSCHYDALKQSYSYARFRTPSNPHQMLYKALLDQSVNNIEQVLINSVSDSYSQNPYSKLKYRRFDVDINNLTMSTAIMLTHNALDLTSNTYFKKLSLIESYTGKIKEKNEWFTKMVSAYKMDRLPFTRFMLSYFGDSEVFSPLASKYLKVITQSALKYEWTALTTRDRMKLTLGFHPNKEVAQEIIKNIK